MHSGGMPKTVSTKESLTPKQREIRQRGSRILDAAFPMIRDGGLTAVNMDAIAKQMKCTRGTIYNHFPHKEDILLALATRSVQRRTRIFEFAISLGSTPREQCAAVGIAAEVYADHMPNDFAIEQMTRHDPLWNKTSPERRDVLEASEQLCLMQVGNVIESAIHSGDLPVDGMKSKPTPAASRQLIERIVFGLWSIVYGGLVLEATGRLVGASTNVTLKPTARTGEPPPIRINQPRTAMRRNCNALMDSVDWQPLYERKTYARFVRKIQPMIMEHVDVIRNSNNENEAKPEVNA